MDKNIETTDRVKGVQDYNNKVIEFAHANTNAAFDVLQKMSDVKSSSVFVELWAEHVRKQVETLTGQSKQLAAQSSIRQLALHLESLVHRTDAGTPRACFRDHRMIADGPANPANTAKNRYLSKR
jgi:Phasin protein.